MIKIQQQLLLSCIVLLVCGGIQQQQQQQQLLLLVDSFPLSSSSPQQQHRNDVVSLRVNDNIASSLPAPRHLSTSSFQLFAQQQDDDEEEEEVYTPRTTKSSTEDENDNKDSNNNNDTNNNNFMDDLTPPPVNFARNSILFSDDPSTKKRNNSALEVWKFTRTYIPAFITGAWPWRDIPTLDERPLAALYNTAFVRLPVVTVAIGYLYQKIYEKHDLIVDFGFGGPLFGNGPQAINPIIVIGILILILL